MGEVAVPAARLWGAQTERSLAHFGGADPLPASFYHAYGVVKKAAALVNARLGKLGEDKAALVVRAAEEVIAGQWDGEFPVSVWQTGSGTQSNMNVNEVIANRAIQLAGGEPGSKRPVHPNDHVNMSQSTNDTFPTAMHVAAVEALERELLPRVEALAAAIRRKAAGWMDVVKIGRTHLQDAVPLTVGQEWGGWASQIEDAMAGVRRAEEGLYRLAAGGTAVGTGLNAPAGFDREIAAEIARLTGRPFVAAPDKFAALGGLDAMASAMSALRVLAVALFKVANDVRWLASGPRSGLGELVLPANEPGSSIMPGKVNPTQSEALMMAAIDVMGADQAVAIAASQGNFQLNVMRPLVIHRFLGACRVLGEAAERFRVHCIEGVELDRRRIAEHVARSLMLVTALAPVIGYDKSAALAHLAVEEDLSLAQANARLGYLTAEEFARLTRPESMISAV